LEAPGQFLRHYSPNIDSFLFKGLEHSELSPEDLSKVVLMDFGALFQELKPHCKHYMDLSAKGDYLEAINLIYDALRWAETMEDAKMVLIANLNEVDKEQKFRLGLEHKAALFDRIFRATSGKEL